ncbi:DUF742 domain-containing protein [Streptomyces violens]|uniref:DUF742 domain-containing protein n=1 Tax=Streptomyces violens TaxID=66377 RepID=UPI000565AD61|nr:DUF742 domain-containing protein [Streptomyces violens]
MSTPQPRRTRTFALTAAQAAVQGETDPAHRITMHSLIRTAIPVEAAGVIPEEWQAVLRWCVGTGIAVAEIAARLHMRLTPTAVMLNELRAHGLVTHQASMTTDQAADVAFLWRVRNRLAEI